MTECRRPHVQRDYAAEARKFEALASLLAHGLRFEDELPSLLHSLRQVNVIYATNDTPSLPTDTASTISGMFEQYRAPAARLLPEGNRSAVDEGISAAIELTEMIGWPWDRIIAIGENRLRRLAMLTCRAANLIENATIDEQLAPGLGPSGQWKQ